MAIVITKVFSLVYKNKLNYSVSLGKSIKGQVKEKDIPLPCRVRLFEKSSGELFSEVLTDNEGNYSFNNLNDELPFYLIAHHPTTAFNAVIQDNVIPK